MIRHSTTVLLYGDEYGNYCHRSFGQDPTNYVHKAWAGPKGLLSAITYSKFGVLHRDGNKVAQRFWHLNGYLASEEYLRYGNYHRIGGSSLTEWNEEGTLLYSSYSLYGNPYYD
jgi:hypothetical protein